MNKKIVSLILLTFALTVTHVFAQDEMLEMTNSYRVCDWGLVVIQSVEAESSSSITITDPTNYAGINSSAFTVSGTGKALFEGTVIVEVTDTEGEVLFTQPTVIDAEVGGEGDWSVDVELGTLEGATQVIVSAYSPDPATGLNDAYDLVQLNANSEFGLSYIDITRPVGNEGVSTSPLLIEGTAGAIFENNVVVQILDFDDNTVLEETFATVDAEEFAGSGAWSVEVDLSFDPGTTFTVYAFQPMVADGEEVTIEDYGIGVASPLAQSYDKILVLQDNDPLTGEAEFCQMTEAEFDNESIVPIVVNEVQGIATMSMMPLVNVSVIAQKPSVCDLPLRVRVTGEENNFTGDLYFSTADGDAPCTRDLRPFTAEFSLGTLPNSDYSLTVNDVELE